MGDQNQGRSGVKELNKTLSLNKKSREVSLERQTSARDSQIAELRSVEVAPSAKPTESPPHVKIDSAFALSQFHRRIKHLEEQIQQNTVPKGLKIKPVKAKSKSEDLQKKFEDILHQAELKFLEAYARKSSRLNTPLLAVKRILTPPSADEDLHFLSRT